MSGEEGGARRAGRAARGLRRLGAAPWGFPAPDDERLYVSYTARQKQRAVERLLGVALVFDAYALLVPGEASLAAAYALGLAALATNALLLALHAHAGARARSALAHAAWLAAWAQVAGSAARRAGDAHNEHLGWALLLQYLTCATLPFHFLLLLLYSALSAAAYLASQLYSHAVMYPASDDSENDFIMQQAVNASLLAAATALGGASYALAERQQRHAFLETKNSLEVKLLIEEQSKEQVSIVSPQQAVNASLLAAATALGGASYALAERQQRHAFLETKNSLEVKLLIEEQSKEQERLLLSVLPEHVAVQMRRDLGLIDTQFKKIYMSRHENVSILYADIVGFTAISSTYSAQDLVAILNELFARFDRLAEKYQQLRIKILGDCYYCISGAPVERPDHAVLCVHMGLSMVKAIKYVQQTTNSPVDMRVGIHTGAVLAGVLGQRQWQFDVYSRDVELANKMESSGMAGRVHISETTLGFLNEEFEVEAAYGERREETLRQAGLKTYFIVRVLKPWSAGGGGGGGGGAADALAAEGGAEEGFPDTPSDLKDDDDESVLSPQDESKMNEEVKILQMLDNELVSRDDNRELEDQTNCCLTFTSPELERGYYKRSVSCPFMFSAPLLLVPYSMFVLNEFAAPQNHSKNYLLIAIMLETGLLNIAYYIYCRWATFKKKKVCTVSRLFGGIFNIINVSVANITALGVCAAAEAAAGEGGGEEARCAHPSYYMHVAVLVVVGALYVSPLRVVPHVALLALLAAAHAPPALYPAAAPAAAAPLPPPISYRLLFGNETDVYNQDGIILLSALYNGRLVIMLFMIVGALSIFIRYNEARSRARYVRAVRMSSQREQAADMRRRNQALVYNVLPPHVAQHFMGARRRHHRDLYSQSYAEVGVLFASMPNFSEFYSEESVNNQGLECLRFLNEVISDFDALLEQSPFKDIIKIKTIGSTYMAASGLNPTRQMQPGDSVTVRWAHLACLVEFALELKRALQGINEQSFNHFVLKMGVNHGPITAGVIGARKPHYDIWGNTVNVASRMESTGKAGCIQVTEETCHILQSFGYYFEQRGLVAVKGKGQLMTYYLQGKGLDPALVTNGSTVMETVIEEEPGAGAGDASAAADCRAPLLANGGGGAGIAGSPRRTRPAAPAPAPTAAAADAALLPIDTF